MCSLEGQVDHKRCFGVRRILDRVGPQQGYRDGRKLANKAIVTLAVGHAYSERFEQFCRKNWMEYAARHGYDIVVFKDPLDRSERVAKRSPAWQKCLVLSQP